MPTYDYECDACNHRFELFQSIMAEPERRCPKCKKLKLRRLIGTGAAVVFKGSGFYQTDYRSESYKKSAAAETKSSGDSSSSDSKSSSDSSASNKTESSKPESSKSTSSKADSPKPASSERSGDSGAKRSKKKSSE